MTKPLVIGLATALLATTAAFAQTMDSPKSSETDATKPSVTEPSAEKMAPATADESRATEKVAPNSASTAADATGEAPTLTDEEAKAWVDKPVYSSDDQNLGEVAVITRDSSGKVSELQAEIGGFLGIGESRVRLMPSDFRFGQDRVLLNLTKEEANKLPAIPK